MDSRLEKRGQPRAWASHQGLEVPGAWSVTHSQEPEPRKLGWTGLSWAFLSQGYSLYGSVAEQLRYVRTAAQSCEYTAPSWWVLEERIKTTHPPLPQHQEPWKENIH